MDELSNIENDFKSGKFSTTELLSSLEGMRASQVECALEQLDLELNQPPVNMDSKSDDNLNDAQFDQLIHFYDSMKDKLSSLFQKVSDIAESEK
ncbi:hypothetical protein P9112_001106 [Eukaryota sp. TZLM1-RC]